MTVTGIKNGTSATGVPKPTVGPDSSDGRVTRDQREKEKDQSDAELIRLTPQQAACPLRRGERLERTGGGRGVNIIY